MPIVMIYKRKLLIWTSLLTLLFLFRVLAQLLERFVDIPLIPNFDQWHSSTLPYPVLVCFQVGILYYMIRTILKIMNNDINFSLQKSRVYLTIGLLYFTSMIIRHILGLTLYSHTVWFTSFLSIYFHYILAAFLILLGYSHQRYSLDVDMSKV